MRNTFRKITILSVLVLLAGFVSHVKGQQNIEEVKVIAGDGFTELRQLLNDNFDFTNIATTEGSVKTQVNFNVAKNGKIVNVKALGDCPEVSTEIENVLNHLLYKLNTSKVNTTLLTTNYVMPVEVFITRR
ncbi:hypothetical protein [Chryseobacterium sp. T1]